MGRQSAGDVACKLQLVIHHKCARRQRGNPVQAPDIDFREQLRRERLAQYLFDGCFPACIDLEGGIDRAIRLYRFGF